jgi:ABC-type nitrate/sulfonate/bicarbonate transport system permease component
MSATKTVSTQLRKTMPAWQRMLLVFLGLVAFNGAFMLVGLWKKDWVVAIIVNFVGVVLLLQWLTEYISVRRLSTYERALAICFPIVMLGVWEALVRAGVLNATWFPPPSRVATALWQLATEYNKFTKTSLLGRPWLIPSMYQQAGWAGVKSLFAESHLWVTLMRIFVGFIAGTIPGLILGVGMGMSRTIRSMLDPVISALYVIPKITILPLMMLIFTPFGETYKIVTVAISAFFVVLINTMAGVREIEPIFIEAGKNYGANGLQLFRHVILPAAMPVIFAGLRLALGTALIVIVAVEFVSGKSGVGYITWYYWEVLNPPKMYAGLIVIMLLGILLTYGLMAVEGFVMPWRRRREQRQVIEAVEG